MKFFFVVFLTFCATMKMNGQNWNAIEAGIPELGRKDIQPDIAINYKVNDDLLKSILWTAPHESEVSARQSNCVITVPLADGSFDQFGIVQYDMMESELAAKYKDIRTFYGFSKTNPYRKIRADYTNYGFRAVIKDLDNPHTYIDHYQRNDKEHKIVYYKNNLRNIHIWTCGFDEIEENQIEEREVKIENRAGNCLLKIYRLAQATTAEYSNFHGAFNSGQEALVMSAVVLVVNRINGVYEEDFTLRTILVNNTDNLFFYNANTDPYTNNDGGTMLEENQTTCDNIIGGSNYDIGHVYSTGGGGVAYLGAICNEQNTNFKAGGVTGQNQPVGDPFAIDYVAHEMGHQFGDQHTQYNNCNRSNGSAMEPGSASSIMGYAGICSPNVQNNSDDYFHARSIQQTASELSDGWGNCYTTPIAFMNNPPIVNDVPNYTIPKSTPFVLTALATDVDNDPMTYCWEQMNAFSNPAQTMPPASTNTSGPMFRSLDDTASPSRYFPPLTNVVNNTANTWEVLPSVARTLNFRVTVRDYHNIAGCTDEDDVTVNVNGTAGPFQITAFNTASSWLEGETKTITWNVAGTTGNGINCANVDIFLSTDGGYTYPIQLAAATVNDGSHNIIVPGNITSTQARFMVRGSGNIFFDVNNANISITPNPISFNLQATTNSQTICNSDTLFVTVSVIPVMGFNNPVTLSLNNPPNGSSYSFSSNPVLPGNTTTLKIFNLSPNTGIYSFVIQGVSGAITKQTNLAIRLDGTIAAPQLQLPAENAIGQTVIPTLSWLNSAGADGYAYQVSRSNTFGFIADEGTAVITSVKLKDGVEGSSQHYWRVKSINACEDLNPWSSPFTFATENCYYHGSENILMAIPIQGTINSINKNPYSGRVDNMGIAQLEGLHTNMDDLQFSLINPNNTEILFWDRPCNNEDDFNIHFSNTALNNNFPCPPTDSATYLPANNLIQTASNKGNWILKIQDLIGGNAGMLNRWGLKACYNQICKLEVDHPYAEGIGSFYNAVNCAQSNDTIIISDELDGWEIDLANNALFIDKNLVIKTNPGISISVKSNSISPALTLTSNAVVTLEGITIKGSNSTITTILNNGDLTLKNLDVLKNGLIASQKYIQNNGQLKIEGNCNLAN